MLPVVPMPRELVPVIDTYYPSLLRHFSTMTTAPQTVEVGALRRPDASEATERYTTPHDDLIPCACACAPSTNTQMHTQTYVHARTYTTPTDTDRTYTTHFYQEACTAAGDHGPPAAQMGGLGARSLVAVWGDRTRNRCVEASGRRQTRTETAQHERSDHAGLCT